MNGGTPQIPSQTVDLGGLATRPSSDPTRTRHTFLGWFTTATGTIPFNFNAPTTANRTAHAQWAPIFTVSFIMRGGTPQVSEQEVIQGGLATRPTNPTREGHTFRGWFTTADGITTFNFGDAITSDTRVFAQWNIRTFTVSFDMQSGNPQEPAQRVNWIALATRPPTDPIREGHTFRGWFTTATGKPDLFDFSTPIVSNRTIFARWNTFIQYTRSDELAELLKIHNYRIERMIIGRGNRIDVRVIPGERPEE